MSIGSAPGTETRPSITREANRTSLIIGAAATGLITLIFFLLFWNRFAGLRSGAGEYGGGMAMLNGLLPYRDYFTAAPPFNIFKSAVILSLFGKTLIASRFAAILERVLIAELVFFWLTRMFQARYAFVGAVLTIILSAQDTADPLASYNHDALLFAVASGFVASFLLGPQHTSARHFAISAAAGLLAGISLLTKQTIGLGATASVSFIVFSSLLRLQGTRKAGLFGIGFVTGWACALGLLLAWLAHIGVLAGFFQQILVKGPAAKASSPVDFFLRMSGMARHYWYGSLPGFLALVLTWNWLRASGNRQVRTEAQPRSLLSLVIFVLCCILGGILAFRLGADRIVRVVFRPVMYYTLFTTMVLGTYCWALILTKRFTNRHALFCLYCGIGFSCYFMLSLSFPYFEAMLLPGLGLIVAAVLEASGSWRSGLLLAICGVLVVAGVVGKLSVPFAFSDVIEPDTRNALYYSKVPALRGLKLPQSTVTLIDGTVDIINRYARPGDTIFLYPELGLFYTITGHNCPTFTCSHNIDVVNDEFARDEARRLIEKPPAVLIYYKQDENFLKLEESTWRHGNPSGNRDLIRATEQLASRYHLRAEYPMLPTPLTLQVYSRD